MVVCLYLCLCVHMSTHKHMGHVHTAEDSLKRWSGPRRAQDSLFSASFLTDHGSPATAILDLTWLSLLGFSRLCCKFFTHGVIFPNLFFTFKLFILCVCVCVIGGHKKAVVMCGGQRTTFWSQLSLLLQRFCGLEGHTLAKLHHLLSSLSHSGYFVC